MIYFKKKATSKKKTRRIRRKRVEAYTMGEAMGSKNWP